MRILFLNPCAQLGGAERCLLDLIASLRRCEPGWRLHLLTGEEGPLVALANARAFSRKPSLFPTPWRGSGPWGAHPLRLANDCLGALPEMLVYSRRLRREIRRIAPDILHSNGLKMHFLGALSGRVPLVWHLHDYLSGRPAVVRALRIASRKCQGAIAISPTVARDARAVLPGRVPVESISNGVDLARFHPRGPKLDLDEMTGIAVPDGTLRVGLVGTYARWKGQDVFLRALADPALADVPIQAYIIGGPIYQTSNSQYSIEELRVMARNLGVADRVIFTGFLSDSAAAMRALDVVVHASTQPEPFGLVIAEAMACGRALVASQCGGAGELFQHNRDALGAAPGNSRQLAESIAALVGDELTRASLGMAARVTAEERFDRDRLGPAIADFYRKIVYPCEYSTSTAEISTAA